MPNATPFTALGAGNGFPFCTESLDVSNRGDGNPYGKWVTLGGTQKGNSPTQTEIDLSLENAMKIFWNYNGHTVSYQSGALEVSINIESGVYNSKSPSGSWTNPKSRICAGNDWDPLKRWSVYKSSPSREARTFAEIKRMYDGSVFLGYGIQFAFYNQFGSKTFSFSSTFYGGSTSYSIGSAYTLLDGIPFVGIATATSSGWNISISGQTATYSKTGETLEIEYKDFDFYTYA
jgi:hypothetical protein